jgi:hypothetical protein
MVVPQASKREMLHQQVMLALYVPVPKPIETKNGDLVENIKMFHTHWSNYLVATANKLESIPEREKIVALLSTIGDYYMKIYNNFSLTE